MGAEIYEIDPGRCTECVGHFDEPQCVQVCPVECIPVNPSFVETREQLLMKFHRLQSGSVSAASVLAAHPGTSPAAGVDVSPASLPPLPA
jgi:formate hydrogenlyase subunit 6/NADH:ubiquinone oxidoreductase subunit I